MNALDISTRWAKGEVVQGRIMMVAGIGFTIATILALDRHTNLIRGFAGPAVLIVLALCGYGANLMFSRPAEINRFVVVYECSGLAPLDTLLGRIGNFQAGATFAVGNLV
jgi:hypothetical protein